MYSEINFEKNEDIIPDNAFYSTKPCPTCLGEGKVPVNKLKDTNHQTLVKKEKKDCPTCGGAKRVKK